MSTWVVVLAAGLNAPVAANWLVKRSTAALRPDTASPILKRGWRPTNRILDLALRQHDAEA
eukprot:1178395-Prorocentrum_minimum.AAC.2